MQTSDQNPLHVSAVRSPGQKRKWQIYSLSSCQHISHLIFARGRRTLPLLQLMTANVITAKGHSRCRCIRCSLGLCCC